MSTPHEYDTRTKQERMVETINIRGVYRHYKGKLYTVAGMAQDLENSLPDSETKEKIVRVILQCYESDPKKYEVNLVSVLKFVEPVLEEGEMKERFTQIF